MFYTSSDCICYVLNFSIILKFRQLKLGEVAYFGYFCENFQTNFVTI